MNEDDHNDLTMKVLGDRTNGLNPLEKTLLTDLVDQQYRADTHQEIFDFIEKHPILGTVTNDPMKLMLVVDAASCLLGFIKVALFDKEQLKGL